MSYQCGEDSRLQESFTKDTMEELTNMDMDICHCIWGRSWAEMIKVKKRRVGTKRHSA
jgi:hypothetical protein